MNSSEFDRSMGSTVGTSPSPSTQNLKYNHNNKKETKENNDDQIQRSDKEKYEGIYQGELGPHNLYHLFPGEMIFEQIIFDEMLGMKGG